MPRSKIKSSGVKEKLNKLPKSRVPSTKEEKIIAETVEWLQEVQKEGDRLPAMREVSSLLREEYGIRISQAALRRRFLGEV